MLRKTTTIHLKLWVIIVLMVLGIKFSQLNAQVKFGNNPSSINANSVLELESTTKGFLLPRLALSSTSSASPMSAHVAGMIVYNTATAGSGNSAVTPGYYYNDGTKWNRLSAIGDVSLIATSLTSATTPAGITAGQMAYNTNPASGLPVGPVYWDGSKWVSAAPGSTNSVFLTSSTTPAGTAVGQVAYNTSTIAPTGLIYWDGSKWVAVNNANSLSLTSSTSPAGSTVGQMAYNTNASSGVPVGPVYWDGTAWKAVGVSGEPWYSVSTNIGATSNTEDIYQLGKVGIGVKNPVAPLQIKGTQSANNAPLELLSLTNMFTGSGTNGKRNSIGMTFRAGDPSNNLKPVGGIYVNTADQISGDPIMEFYTMNMSSLVYNPRMCITDTGWLGIGTRAPQGILDIKGISGANSGAVFKSGTNGDPTLSFYNSTGAMTRINSTNGGFGFYSFNRDNSTNAPDLTLANGNVGIGTSSPATKLEVNNGTTPGAIKIVDGTQGANKVLTSDGTGVGSWQTPTLGSYGGVIFGSSNYGSITLSGSTWEYLGESITLTPGTWLICYNFQASMNGYTLTQNINSGTHFSFSPNSSTAQIESPGVPLINLSTGTGTSGLFEGGVSVIKTVSSTTTFKLFMANFSFGAGPVVSPGYGGSRPGTFYAIRLF